ncbi:MAG TPA: hypothetical protein VFE42_25495 [Chloroflexota bacterium]|nr:hypothetical protein [Chloroflexota bacterium]
MTKGRFLLGLLVWCIVTTFVFHSAGGWGMAAIDLGGKVALVVDCLLFLVWKPSPRRV